MLALTPTYISYIHAMYVIVCIVLLFMYMYEAGWVSLQRTCNVHIIHMYMYKYGASTYISNILSHLGL